MPHTEGEAVTGIPPRILHQCKHHRNQQSCRLVKRKQLLFLQMHQRAFREKRVSTRRKHGEHDHRIREDAAAAEDWIVSSGEAHHRNAQECDSREQHQRPRKSLA